MCRTRLDANKAFIALPDPGIGGNSFMYLDFLINMWHSVYLLYFLSDSYQMDLNGVKMCHTFS